MNTAPLTTEFRQGIPESARDQAAELYATVFAAKYQYLIGDGQQAMRIIAACLCINQAFAAFCQDQLVGLAGFNREGSHFLRLRAAVLINEFGLLVGLWRYLIHRIQRKRVPARDLQIDGIVVAPEWRGQGLGSELIDRLGYLAQQRNLSGLRLGVVDTNPRARQLYERLGFLVVETRHYAWLRTFIPFTALHIMRLPLAPLPGISAPPPRPSRIIAIRGMVRWRRGPLPRVIVWRQSRSV